MSGAGGVPGLTNQPGLMGDTGPVLSVCTTPVVMHWQLGFIDRDTGLRVTFQAKHQSFGLDLASWPQSLLANSRLLCTEFQKP